MASVHQQNVANYHEAMSQHGHHGGHNMYIFHRDWHQQNTDPSPPAAPDSNWGMDLPFGTNFLQMHHEMVKGNGVGHQHMLHASLVSWYQEQGLSLPALWNPLESIPTELGYDPDPSIFPDEIRVPVENFAQSQGMTVTEFLTRGTNTPAFALPRYFTAAGVGPGEASEPITGARKLADFQNTNQMGCCLVFPHNQWHGSIGGAMSTTWTAIADPIFYFGVHWHIDRVFDEYKALQSEGLIQPLGGLESAPIALPQQFTPAQKAWAAEQVAISKRLHLQ
jgi:hypothetical protein